MRTGSPSSRPLKGTDWYLVRGLDCHNAFLAENSWVNRLFLKGIQHVEGNKYPVEKRKNGVNKIKQKGIQNTEGIIIYE